MRTAGWEKRLSDFLIAAQSARFQWGETDCALWACEAMRLMTGIDPAETLRGKYRDSAGADREIAPYRGLGNLAKIFARRYGMEKIRPRMAQRGDIVLARINYRETLGVCEGAYCAFLRLTGGLYHMPIDSRQLLTAWRVG